MPRTFDKSTDAAGLILNPRIGSIKTITGVAEQKSFA